MKTRPVITSEQHKKISNYLFETSWNHIYDKILTPEQRKFMKKNKEFEKRMCFDMEDHYKAVANEFGLNALLDE